MMLNNEFIKKYFSHPKFVSHLLQEELDHACKDMHENADWKYHFAKMSCILSDFFKSEGVSPESYIIDVERMKK